MKKENIQILITLVSTGCNDPLQQSLQRIFSGNALYQEPGVCVFRIAPGILIQLCGPGAQVPPGITSVSSPLVSYAVDDMKEAIKIASEHGAVILQQATNDCTALSFCYLQFPGEKVVGFFNNG